MKHFESQVKIKGQDNEMNKLLVYRPLSLFFILVFSFNFSSVAEGSFDFVPHFSLLSSQLEILINHDSYDVPQPVTEFFGG